VGQNHMCLLCAAVSQDAVCCGLVLELAVACCRMLAGVLVPSAFPVQQKLQVFVQVHIQRQQVAVESLPLWVSLQCHTTAAVTGTWVCNTLAESLLLQTNRVRSSTQAAAGCSSMLHP
jgi:hypothetical protein